MGKTLQQVKKKRRTNWLKDENHCKLLRCKLQIKQAKACVIDSPGELLGIHRDVEIDVCQT